MADKSPPLNELSEMSSNSLFVVDESDLLSRAKLNWYYGNWEALAEISIDQIEQNKERASLATLLASAHLQLADSNQANYFAKLAIEWAGRDSKKLGKILVAGAFNALGRIRALQGKEEQMEKAFANSVDVGASKDIEMIAHSRAIREMAKMGLLPQAANRIDKKLKSIIEKPSAHKNLASQTKVLQTELELLTHELNISLQRSQLYTPSHNSPEGQAEYEIGSPEHLEYLKRKSTSQLGQDIWVLEKTNFKRNGFFVEFGATDGVLLSNTYLLEKEFNWRGICAEPNTKFYKQLVSNRNCIVSDECIGGTTGEKVSFVFAQEYGGMQKHMADDMHKDKRQAYLEEGKEGELETISLHDFLIKNSAPKFIDYLSIDTEGSEFEILKEFPLDQWDIKYLSIEHNFSHQREKIYKLLSSFNYVRTESRFDDWYEKV